MNAFHPLHISQHALETVSLPMQDILPSLQDLEHQVVTAIQARDDFIHSRLPSSLTHCGYWLLAGVFATGSAAMVGATVAWGIVLGNDIYRKATHSGISPMELTTLATIGTLSLGVPLFPVRVLVQLTAMMVNQIREDNEDIVESLERDIENACSRLAEAALALSPVDFERLLQRGEVPLSSLVAACGDDVDKSSLLAERLLISRQPEALLLLADRGLGHCHAVGDVLLRALDHPQAFVEMLESTPVAAGLLAVLCLAHNAMSDDPPDALDAYLQRHPDVAQRTLDRVGQRLETFGALELLTQFRQSRLAGIAMAVTRHAQPSHRQTA